MSQGYAFIVIIVILSMIVEIVHLVQNESIRRDAKYTFIVLSSLIIAGVSLEFLGVYFDGCVGTSFIHKMVKTFELFIAISIPFGFYIAIRDEEVINVYDYPIIIIVFVAYVINILNIFYPILFTIDENDLYVRGRFFIIYPITYVLEAIIVTIKLIYRMNKFQNKNRISVISMLLFYLICFIYSIFNYSLRADYLIVGILEMFFISYFSDMTLKVDELTQLLNRRTYENHINSIFYKTCIIKMDVNNFKEINDTYGHSCGDVCLKVIADTILEVYSSVGYCYRTGGDEFDVIFKPRIVDKYTSGENRFDLYKKIGEKFREFDDVLEKKIDDYPMLKYGVSQGFGIYYRDNEHDIRYVIDKADERMYKNKQISKEKIAQIVSESK